MNQCYVCVLGLLTTLLLLCVELSRQSLPVQGLLRVLKVKVEDTSLEVSCYGSVSRLINMRRSLPYVFTCVGPYLMYLHA